MDAVGLLHAAFERDHRAGHARVIHRADVEIKILERFGAHAGGLRHARRGPAEDDPAGLVHAIIQDGAKEPRVKLHLVARHVGGFAGVGAAAHGDVSVHLFHAEQFDVADEGGVAGAGVEEHFARDAAMADLGQRCGPGATGGADQLDGHFVRDVDGIDEHAVPFPEAGGVADEDVGELTVARVGHRFGGRTLTEPVARAPFTIFAAVCLLRRFVWPDLCQK